MKKRVYLLPMFLLPLLTGCGKEYTCNHNISYLPVSVVFTGYPAGTLQQFVVSRYKAGTGFAQLLGVDTFVTVPAIESGDTVYRSYDGWRHKGFFQIEEGIDYKVVAGQPAKTHTITEIHTGDSIGTWTQSTPCSPGSGQMRFESVYAKATDGETGAPIGEANNYLLFLHR